MKFAVIGLLSLMLSMSVFAQAKVKGHHSKMTKYKVIHANKETIAKQIGLKPGDVIKTVNGHPISNPTDAMNAYNKMETPGKYRLEVERKGKKKVFLYKVED